jgi:diadenosine tetraphosphatase ApaH/serine/threonine PP2A family protein phosphatase
MAVLSRAITLAVLSALGCATVRAETELIPNRKGSMRATVQAAAFQGQLRDSLGQVLGCGDSLGQGQLERVKQTLMPIWNSLPKTGDGRIERRLLRYVTHRYFMKTSAIMIRGFEPSRPSNQSIVGTADILSQQVPAAVEAALESKHAQERGFDLADAAHMVATIEKLIAEWDFGLLEKVYRETGMPMDKPIGREGLETVLQDYTLYWMMGDDSESIQSFIRDRVSLMYTFPHWSALQQYVNGQIRAVDFDRKQSGARLSFGYTIEDARRVVSTITRSFASFWDDECGLMKEKLVEMDPHHTGRVPLSKFYSRRLSKEWRFGESEGYLRELGALDETSYWHGKEVIIPNYIAAASNCIVTTPHYLVCCVDPCEGILSEIESGIGAAVATPDELLALVGNMSTMRDIYEEEEHPRLQGSLSKQLGEIAAHHGGLVPLHGRLFAQWLHYAFPRECPFPHRSGTTSVQIPSEFGEYIVQEDDRLEHAGNETALPVEVKKEDLQWMSQWSLEEELHSDYSSHLPAAWSTQRTMTVGLLLLCAASLAGLASKHGLRASSASFLPTHGKVAHTKFV